MTRWLIAALLAAGPALAEPPEVLAAEAVRTSAGWRLDVTLRHPDTGWDHYADAWEVLDATGNTLGLRELAHPHETEQPFTRSLTLRLPGAPAGLWVRARCNVDGWNATAEPVDLP